MTGANIAILTTELSSDPLARGYSGMDDATAAASLNTADRSVERTLVPSHEVYEQIVPSEWGALQNVEKDRIGQILSMGIVNVQGANTRAAFAAAFSAGTTTRSNLLAYQTRPASRAEELGLPQVKAGHVEQARS